MILSINRIALNNKILKNFSVLTLSNALSQFFFIFTSIKIARTLNPLTYGTYNLLQLNVSIFAVIASLGLRNIIIRNIARDKSVVKNVFYVALIIRIIGFLLSIILFCIYFFFNPHYDVLLFVLIILSILSNVLFDLFESVAFGLEKMEFSGIINLLNSFLWVLTIMLIPKNLLSLHLIFSIFVLLSFLKTVIYFFSIYKGDYIKGFNFEPIEKDQIITFSKESFPYYYLALFTLLSNQIPLLFLEYRSGIEQIGFFNIASKVLLPITLVLSTALAAIFPTLSRLFVTDYKLFIKNVKLIFTLISIFSITGAFGVTFFRQEVIHILYGEKYNNTSLVLGYQCWYIAVYSGVSLIGCILGAINKQKELSYLSIACTIIQVPILWYGSKFGAQYLSAAFLLATIINFILHIYVINLYLKNALSVFFYLKIFALYITGYFISLLIPVNLSLQYKVIIFIFISIIAGYFIYRKYLMNLKRIFQ